MSDEKGTRPDVQSLFKTLLDVRNLEINLFWQRSNYFLVLNSAIGFGFFNLQDRKYGAIFALMGLASSLLWLMVCLGGKFWQTRWEQRIQDFEKEHLPGLNFFGSSQERVHADVKIGLASDKRPWPQRFIYRLVLRKPSVSYAMIRLAILFVVGWLGIIGAYILALNAQLSVVPGAYVDRNGVSWNFSVSKDPPVILVTSKRVEWFGLHYRNIAELEAHARDVVTDYLAKNLPNCTIFSMNAPPGTPPGPPGPPVLRVSAMWAAALECK